MPTIKIVPMPGVAVAGPQGPRGPQGIQGETGLTGPIGPAGDTADFVFESSDERSTISVANKDLYIQTTSDDGQNFDIEIVSEDDIRATANDLISLRAGNEVVVRTGWDSTLGESNYRWEFNNDGEIIFPDGTAQTTAYTAAPATGASGFFISADNKFITVDNGIITAITSE